MFAPHKLVLKAIPKCYHPCIKIIKCISIECLKNLKTNSWKFRIHAGNGMHGKGIGACIRWGQPELHSNRRRHCTCVGALKGGIYSKWFGHEIFASCLEDPKCDMFCFLKSLVVILPKIFPYKPLFSKKGAGILNWCRLKSSTNLSPNVLVWNPVCWINTPPISMHVACCW